MANDVLFEVDASQIIAKLHLAGIQNSAFPDKATDFIVNTGIKNDDPKLKPDNPGKVSFDLKSPSGEYQVGFVTLIKYHKTYELENILDDIAEIYAKTAGDESKISDDEKTNKELIDQREEMKQKVNSICKEYGINEITEEQFADPKAFDNIKKEIIGTIGQKDKEMYEDAEQKTRENAVKTINTYMSAFAGNDNFTKMTDKMPMQIIMLSDKIKDSNSSGLVRDFEIQPISEQEKAKLIGQFKASYQKNPNIKNLNCEHKICFIVNYTLNVDK